MFFWLVFKAFLGCKHWNMWGLGFSYIFILASIWLALSRKQNRGKRTRNLMLKLYRCMARFSLHPSNIANCAFSCPWFFWLKAFIFHGQNKILLSKACSTGHSATWPGDFPLRATENRLIISTWPCSGIIIGIWWNMLIEHDWKQPNWWPYSLIHFEAYCFVFGTAFPVGRKYKVADFSVGLEV